MNPYRRIRNKLESNPVTNRLLLDIRFRSSISTVLSFLINLAFALYNCFLGITYRSFWFVTMAFYYILLGTMRFHAVQFIKKNNNLEESERIKKEYSLMKQVGRIFLFLPLALSGTVILTIKQNHVQSYGTITMLTIATYTFYKIFISIWGLIKIHKQHSPLLSAIRNISTADATMSILPMQSSMIVSFDNGTGLNFPLMTALTGSGICIIILWLGITMLKHTSISTTTPN